MPNVTASYGTLLEFLAFFKEFLYITDDYSCLRYCIFTKFSQITCLINIHILECQHARCDCNLWNVPFNFNLLLIFSENVFLHLSKRVFICFKTCFYTFYAPKKFAGGLYYKMLQITHLFPRWIFLWCSLPAQGATDYIFWSYYEGPKIMTEYFTRSNSKFRNFDRPNYLIGRITYKIENT